jgi:glutamyl/glutaminyl-tRNA synthetase
MATTRSSRSAQAIEWFDLDGVGRAASRFDIKPSSTNVNAHYMRLADDARLVALVVPRIAAAIGRDLIAADTDLLLRSMSGLKIRAKNINELADSAIFYLRTRPIPIGRARGEFATPPEAGDLLAQVHREPSRAGFLDCRVNRGGRSSHRRVPRTGSRQACTAVACRRNGQYHLAGDLRGPRTVGS